MECGVLVYVEEGKVKKIKGDPTHPTTKGFICVKGETFAETAYHKDRIKYPLKRIGKRGEGIWQQVSWAQALDELAERITEIKDRYGAKSIATMHGTGPRPATYSMSLLACALGTPNHSSLDHHLCLVPSLVAEWATLGTSVMMENGTDYENTNCVVIWGGNPLLSHPPRGLAALEAKRKRNAKLIVVDPRRTQLATEADVWLQPRPGTDLALALGMINIIIQEDLYDKEFVEKWTYDFERLKDHVKTYALDRVSEITWVAAEKIREAARTYSLTRPGVLHHRIGTEQNLNSTQTDRALAIMIGLTGNVDVKGGNVFSMPHKGYFPDNVIRGSDENFRPGPELERSRIGAEIYPLTSGYPSAPIPPFVNSPLLVEAILTGKPYPVKALFQAGTNPLNMTNFRKVWSALNSLELSVVIDFFMTPSAEIADYVLPAATWLERDDTCDTKYMTHISARQKAIPSLYDSWHDMKIIIELVKRLPWSNRKYVPWNSVEEFNDWRLKGMGVTFEQLKEKGSIMRDEMIYKKYEKKGFNTPTSKIEFYSTTFEKYGYDPLPTYLEPTPSPVSTPELFQDYPLILITGGRKINYFHTEGRQIESLRKIQPDPEIEINPRTAAAIGVRNHDWVWVETPGMPGERVKLKAVLTDNIDQRVVHATHGWWFPEKPPPEHGCFESNINLIISDQNREKICGSVPDRCELCKVYA